MTEHVHEWKLRFIHNKVIADSHTKDGKWLKTLFENEIERRLNDYETLKKATKALSVVQARAIAREFTSVGAAPIRYLMRKQLIAYADVLEGK